MKLTQNRREAFGSKWIKLEEIYLPATLVEDYSDIYVYKHPLLEAKLGDLKELRKNIKTQYKNLKKDLLLHAKLVKEIEKLDSGTY